MNVAQVLDQLAAGAITLEQAEADFRTRAWPTPQPPATYQQATVGDAGVTVDPNSWEVVNVDSRLTPEAYRRLAAARSESTARG